MKFFKKMKDGGPESKVTGYWLIESKRFFSIALLRFDHGSREAYHSHAFNAVSWVLSGALKEELLGLPERTWYFTSLVPIRTPRSCFHKVTSFGRTWVLTFRGPWARTWREFLPNEGTFGEFRTLTHGRERVA